MSYCPHTVDEQKEMLGSIGVSSVADLFKPIPKKLRAKSFDLPPGMSEFEMLQRMTSLAASNAQGVIPFIGGGFYDHLIPTAVDHLSGRAEFYTAYTPYQPECSQGSLQALFEYQTAICRMTGMEASNASLYDGGTALAEAAMMALRVTGRNRLVIELRQPAKPTSEPPAPVPQKPAAEPPPAKAEPVAAKVQARSAVTIAPANVERIPVPAKRAQAGTESLVRALGLKLDRVVIDPGHGGGDTGTIGPTGLQEKDLVLDVSRRLGALIEERLGAEVVYTRTEDVTVPLEERTALANSREADLFLSIHANAGVRTATACARGWVARSRASTSTVPCRWFARTVQSGQAARPNSRDSSHRQSHTVPTSCRASSWRCHATSGSQ